MAEPIRALERPARTRTIYPPPYDAALAGRAKRALGDAFNLTQSGVNPTTLTPGMCAGFKAAVPNGHMLVNKSAASASYLEIGTRAEGDRARDPDADMLAVKEGGKYRLTHKDGTPY